MSRQAIPTVGDIKNPEWLLKISHRLNELLVGRANVTTLATLLPGVTTTTIVDGRISVSTAVVLVPTTLTAAAEIANGTLYIAETGRVNGSIVITHANAADADRTYRVLLMG